MNTHLGQRPSPAPRPQQEPSLPRPPRRPQADHAHPHACSPGNPSAMSRGHPEAVASVTFLLAPRCHGPRHQTDSPLCRKQSPPGCPRKSTRTIPGSLPRRHRSGCRHVRTHVSPRPTCCSNGFYFPSAPAGRPGVLLECQMSPRPLCGLDCSQAAWAVPASSHLLPLKEPGSGASTRGREWAARPPGMQATSPTATHAQCHMKHEDACALPRAELSSRCRTRVRPAAPRGATTVPRRGVPQGHRGAGARTRALNPEHAVRGGSHGAAWRQGHRPSLGHTSLSSRPPESAHRAGDDPLVSPRRPGGRRWSPHFGLHRLLLASPSLRVSSRRGT